MQSESVELQELLRQTKINNDIESALTNVVPNINSFMVNAEYGVEAVIELIIDTTNTDDIQVAIGDFEKKYNDTFSVESEELYITSLPTKSPIMIPSFSPETTIPSAGPTITGLILSLGLSLAVTEKYTTEQLNALEQQIQDIYDVTSENFVTEVEYTVTGALDLDNIPEYVSQEEIKEVVIASIAEELGVHPKDIEIISVDMRTGNVVYEISSNTYDGASEIQDQLKDVKVEDLEENIQDVIPEIIVDSNNIIEFFGEKLYRFCTY